MSTKNYQLIRDAVLDKKQIHAKYQKKVYEMCPHVLGIKDGEKACLFYVFGGGDGDIVLNDWKTMNVSDLSMLTVHDGEWHSADDVSVVRKSMDQIDVR